MADAPELQMQLRSIEHLSMEQIHAAWLAAGANGDAATMRCLRVQHPQWLDLQRLVASDLTVSSQNRFCSWKYFHMPTIGASALLAAAWDGCAEIVELLLEAGQDPDTCDNGGLTSMMVAMLRYNVVVMRCVFRNNEAIRRNLVVDCREEELQLVQHVIAVLDLLLRFGADVNVRNQEGYSALHYAGNGDALAVAEFLLDASADIDQQDQNDKTPLHHCIREGSLLVANLLVSRGAQIDIEDVNGETPLTLALQRGRGNVLQIILNQHHVVVTAERKDFAAFVLLNAVENENEEAVHLTVEGGYTPVTISNDADEIPLHRAIVKRNSTLMELLISLDPDEGTLTAATLTGDTPAHYAAHYGSVHEIETLLRHLSTVVGDLQALDEVANPLNVLNNEGLTCLYLAGSRKPHEERDTIVQLLRHHGARLFRRDCILAQSSLQCPEKVIFHHQVCRGVALWVRQANDRVFQVEDGNGDRNEARTSDVLFTELCMEWVGGIASPILDGKIAHNWPDFAAVLHVAIFSGYALEFMPLMLELPLFRSAMPVLLQRLERFARFPRTDVMLLQLRDELSEALLGLALQVAEI